MDFSRLDGAARALHVLCWGVCVPFAVAAAADEQLRRLMEPSAAELAVERQGRVQIYEELYASQVEQAMDVHFERIENMMFTRVRHPAPDAEVGYEVANDGCD